MKEAVTLSMLEPGRNKGPMWYLPKSLLLPNNDSNLADLI